MLKKINFKAFTLVEIMVSITIFSIMMISIVGIYIVITDINTKSDINRMMQENVKNTVSHISEDIIKSGINFQNPTNTLEQCYNVIPGTNYEENSRLCTKLSNKYYVAKKISGGYSRITNMINNCDGLLDKCMVIKEEISGEKTPLTNSYVSVKNLHFYVSNDDIPKVTINITLKPAVGRGLKPSLIEKTELIFQTTITERPF